MLTELQKAAIKFDQDTARLIDFAKSKGIPCFTHEKGLLSSRRIILPDGRIAKGTDAVHKQSGNHYRFLAFDLIVFDKRTGKRLTKGTELEWKILGEFWESLDPKNANGRGWGDANHFSRIWNNFK